MTQSANDVVGELDQLHKEIKDQSTQLETAIAQVDQYQVEVQQLRQQIIQVEQQLRSVMAPTHLPQDRDQAVRDQQVGVAVLVFVVVFFFELSCLSNGSGMDLGLSSHLGSDLGSS